MCILGRFSVRSKRASKQLLRWRTSGSASGVTDAARGATAGRRRNRMACEVASSAKMTRIVQLSTTRIVRLSVLATRRDRTAMACSPVFFGVMPTRMHTAARATRRRSDARRPQCDYHSDSAFGCESDAPYCVVRRVWASTNGDGGAARAGTHHYVQTPLLDVLVALVFVVDRRHAARPHRRGN